MNKMLNCKLKITSQFLVIVIYCLISSSFRLILADVVKSDRRQQTGRSRCIFQLSRPTYLFYRCLCHETPTIVYKALAIEFTANVSFFLTEIYYVLLHTYRGYRPTTKIFAELLTVHLSILSTDRFRSIVNKKLYPPLLWSLTVIGRLCMCVSVCLSVITLKRNQL